VWLEADDVTLHTTWGINYKSGFHVFHHLKDAERHKIFGNSHEKVVRVVVGNPIVVGMQGNCVITVAKRIKITQEVS